jgi:hypothetical protein
LRESCQCRCDIPVFAAIRVAATSLGLSLVG